MDRINRKQDTEYTIQNGGSGNKLVLSGVEWIKSKKVKGKINTKIPYLAAGLARRGFDRYRGLSTNRPNLKKRTQSPAFPATATAFAVTSGRKHEILNPKFETYGF